MLDLITAPIGVLIGGLVAILAPFVTHWLGKRQGRSAGRTEAQQEMQNADHENAADIRRRARDADGNGVQPDDTRGFRN